MRDKFEALHDEVCDLKEQVITSRNHSNESFKTLIYLIMFFYAHHAGWLAEMRDNVVGWFNVVVGWFA